MRPVIKMNLNGIPSEYFKKSSQTAPSATIGERIDRLSREQFGFKKERSKTKVV